MTRTDRYPFLGQVALAGVGYTDLTKRSGRSVLSLATEAVRRALDDAGLRPDQVGAMATYSMFGDSVPTTAVASALGMGELTWGLDLSSGGTAPSLLVMNAAMVVAAGVADAVVIFRALNGRSGVRVGSTRQVAPTAQYRYPIGLVGYAQYVALLARRYMIETGADETDLAAVVLAQREYAVQNERAVIRRPLTETDYLAAPYVAEPFRRADCTSEIDGACAFVVTSLERARDLATHPVVIEGTSWVTSRGAGLDMGDFQSYKDYLHIAQIEIGRRLWADSGMTPGDIDVAMLYDAFSSTVLMGLESLGFVGRGEAGDFVKSGSTRLGGSLPVNTNGGLLSEGYLHGMNLIGEAFEQLQGRCGPRQVPGARRVVVTSGAYVESSGLILARAD
jgi:acetyl-CoA acetyltransferase